ncbi:MAG: hypothetical protein KBA51_06945 [Kiritimatiellae bacterium]|nr:hypothetical protein [Kiritimatiellia bacterium]
MKFMKLAIVAALLAMVSAYAETAPAPKQGCGEGQGQGFGQWKKNAENIQKFDANGDGVISGEEETAAKAAWKQTTGKGCGCKGEKKEGGCETDKKAEGCGGCESEK